MKSRERVRTVLNFGIPDRVPTVDIGFWPATLERWRKEGLPEDATPDDHFGLDRIPRIRFSSTFGLEPELLEETDEYKVHRDENGVLQKAWKDHYATPLQLDFAVKTREDWLPMKERLQPVRSRISEETREAHGQHRQTDCFVTLSPVEPVWQTLRVLGHDHALMHMADDPGWMADMFQTYTDFGIRMAEIMLKEGLDYDGVWFFSDLCYKNGMLFSPRTYRELMMPCHRRWAEFCRSHDVPLMLHCDGDVRELIPLLIEAGFGAIQPIEARAGNDVREFKRLYGNRIVFMGNISTDVMSRSKSEIEEEVRTKVLAAKEGGGYIYHCDHSIPPTVSLENYRYVIASVRKHGAYD